MINEIVSFVFVRKTSKQQIKCFKYISCRKITYLFVQLLHIEIGNWLMYQRDQLRISQNTNTWIKDAGRWCCGTGLRHCPGGVVLPAVGLLSPIMTRVLPLTRRMLQGWWGAWPAWWGVNQHQIHAQAHWVGGEGGGHQIWIIYNMVCNTFKLLCYVLHRLRFSKQLSVMSYNRVYDNFYMLYTTIVT